MLTNILSDIGFETDIDDKFEIEGQDAPSSAIEPMLFMMIMNEIKQRMPGVFIEF